MIQAHHHQKQRSNIGPSHIIPTKWGFSQLSAEMLRVFICLVRMWGASYRAAWGHGTEPQPLMSPLTDLRESDGRCSGGEQLAGIDLAARVCACPNASWDIEFCMYFCDSPRPFLKRILFSRISQLPIWNIIVWMQQNWQCRQSQPLFCFLYFFHALWKSVLLFFVDFLWIDLD